MTLAYPTRPGESLARRRPVVVLQTGMFLSA